MITFTSENLASERASFPVHSYDYYCSYVCIVHFTDFTSKCAYFSDKIITPRKLPVHYILKQATNSEFPERLFGVMTTIQSKIQFFLFFLLENSTSASRANKINMTKEAIQVHAITARLIFLSNFQFCTLASLRNFDGQGVTTRIGCTVHVCFMAPC